MRKIEYSYTTVARQLMFIVFFLYILLRFTVITQIFFFKIDKYYEAINFPLTYTLYLILFILIIGLFFQHRFFYSTYTKETLTYENKLLRRKQSINFSEITSVVADVWGIYFFKESNLNRTKKNASFILPHFRGGRIEAAQLDKLLKYLESRDISVTKTYKIMPGYGKTAKILSFVYGIIALCIVGTSLTPIQTVIVLFMSH